MRRGRREQEKIKEGHEERWRRVGWDEDEAEGKHIMEVAAVVVIVTEA